MITMAWLVLSTGISTSLIIVALAYAYKQYMEFNKSKTVIPVTVDTVDPLQKRLQLMNERFAVPMKWEHTTDTRPPAPPPPRVAGPGRRREP